MKRPVCRGGDGDRPLHPGTADSALHDCQVGVSFLRGKHRLVGFMAFLALLETINKSSNAQSEAHTPLSHCPESETFQFYYS